MKTKLSIRPTGMLYVDHETHMAEEPTEYVELKGRLEFRKDKAAWAYAMSKNPYVYTWQAEPLEVSAVWLYEVAEEGIRQLEEDIVYAYNNCQKLWPNTGVEPHVLVESLKLADEYNGDRNGPLANNYRE